MQSIPLRYAPADFVPFPKKLSESISIWQRFESICATCAQRQAVVDGLKEFNYTELLQTINGLADELQQLDLPAGASAAVVLDTNWNSVTAMFALIKSGIMFLPIDTSLPEHRIRKHVDCCEVDLIVTSSAHSGLMKNLGPDAVIFAVDQEHEYSTVARATRARPREGVCQILTSGSSGKPKRVIYTQTMILHDVAVRTNSLRISTSDRVAQWLGGTSLPLMTMFLTLLNGASLHICDVRRRGHSDLIGWIEDSRISILRLTPTLLRYVGQYLDSLQRLKHLRLVSTGGESLNTDDVAMFRQRFPTHALLLNHLSSTEYRVACQYFIGPQTRLQGHIVPVGYALEDFEIDIVDERGEPVPAGTSGEIIVRSAYISPGYVEGTNGDTILFPRDQRSGIISYRSGDLGLKRDDGCIEYRGRNDRMMKIGGYRVELEEIEAVLRPLVTVEQVAAVVFEDTKKQPGLAVFIAGAQVKQTINDIRKKVFAELGLFGMPQRVVIKHELPVTSNGKIDRRALSRELEETKSTAPGPHF